MVEELRYQRTVNIRPCQPVARIEAVIEFSETAPCLAAPGGIAVVAVQSFAGFYLLDKMVKKIPDIRAFSFSGYASFFRFFPLLLFFSLPCNSFSLLLTAHNL